MNADAKVNNQIFRKDYPQIIALNRQLADLQPVRLAHDTDGYVAGQALARNTSSGFWEKWSAVSGASPDSHCILMEDHPGEEFTGSTGTALGIGIYAGDLYKDKLTQCDSNMITALKARTIVNNGDNILKF